MEEFIFSKHAIEQMMNRNISMEIVLKVLEYPEQIIIEKELKVYQSIFTFSDIKRYLVRIIVNSLETPKIVITVCKTSKLKKYYEG